MTVGEDVGDTMTATVGEDVGEIGIIGTITDSAPVPG